MAAAQANLARSESEGQRRMLDLHSAGAAFDNDADPHSLEIHPNLWAGVGLVRGGAGTALVGSYREVAERIAEYHALGLDHFILSGIRTWRRRTTSARVRPQLARLGLVEQDQGGDVVHGAFLPTLRAASS